MEPITIAYREYIITTDRSLLQPEAVHQWLSTESYWAKGIPYETVKTSFDHSFVAGALYKGAQIGFARLVTDYATFAYLADVYVTETHRGRGISKQIMQLIMNQEWVQGLRRILLTTMDAHSLYAQFGFIPVPFPERIMVINKPDFYRQETSVDSTEKDLQTPSV